MVPKNVSVQIQYKSDQFSFFGRQDALQKNKKHNVKSDWINLDHRLGAYEKSQFCINSVGDRYNLGVCVVVYVFFLCESTKHNNYIQRGWIGSTRTYHMVRIMYTGTHFVDRHMCGHVGSVHLVALTSVAAHSTIHHIDPEKKRQSFANSVFFWMPTFYSLFAPTPPFLE